MFSFLAWFSLIGGFIVSGKNFYIYFLLSGDGRSWMQAEEHLKYAVVMLVSTLISFAIFRRLAKMEKTIDNLEARVNSLSTRLERVSYKAGAPNVDVEKESLRADGIKQQINEEKTRKYYDHIAKIANRLGAGKCTKSELRAVIFAPKDWEENILGSRETCFSMYRYYEDILPILFREKAHVDVVLEMCEEAYRLIGFLADNLKGESSEIMSYYCDVEKKTYGKSSKFTAMCQKLDSIGVLDRGLPFSCRLR